MTEQVFSRDVVDAVVTHLNDDHAEDCLRIVRALGGVVGVRSVTATTVDPSGARFLARTADGDRPVTIPWSRPVRERADIRAEIVGMHDRASAAEVQKEKPMTEARRPPTPRTAQVLRTERISASLVRVVVGGPGLAGFAPVHADSYVKVVFPPADGAPADRPRLRTYTVRAFDPDSLELTVDFVVHGDTGLAGPWAAAAQPGDEVQLLGPGGGWTPSPDADWHVLIGDESALPAIAVGLERMPAVPVQVFLEVHGPADEIALPDAPGAVVTWLHRGTGAVGSRLVETVTGWTPPDGTGHWFVHGEAGVVKDLRRHLRVERGLPLSQLSISGYWRLGVDDEGWRAVKRDWNAEVEQAERAAVG